MKASASGNSGGVSLDAIMVVEVNMRSTISPASEQELVWTVDT